MHKSTLLIIELCFGYELFLLKDAKHHFRRESVMSEWVRGKVLLQVQQWRGLQFSENVHRLLHFDARLLQ